MHKNQREDFLTPGALLLAALCWGSAPVATRYLLTYFNPLPLLLLRFLIAAICFLPMLVSLRTYPWSKRDGVLAIFCGMTAIIGYNVIVTYGLRWIPAGIAGLLLATEPIWIALISFVILRERLRWQVITGLLLALAGIAVLSGTASLTSFASGNPTFIAGTALVLLSAMMWAMYVVAVRPLSRKFGARSATAVTIVLGTIPLLAFGNTNLIPRVIALPFAAWASLILLAIGSTVVATICFNYGVARTSSSRAGLFLYLVPLVSIAGGGLFLHERVGPTVIMSGLLIIAGVALAQVQHLPWSKPQQSQETMDCNSSR
jgi:drug/metabolite transporter (DMT)-like permease